MRRHLSSQCHHHIISTSNCCNAIRISVNHSIYEKVISIMASHTFSQKSFKAIPPEKGSFPLDHEGLCRKLMVKYMRCLWENKNNAHECRASSKDYLECRMEHNLMAKESWKDLGFQDIVTEETHDQKKL